MDAGAERFYSSALDVENLTFADEGLAIMIRRSKTDPEGEGQVKAIRPGGLYCPIAALRTWLKSADIRSRRDLTKQVTESLKATRESVSGVSIDEELANIIQFQQNFGATARLMKITAELLQQIVDIL